jgi:hypothetical protein
VRFGLLTALLLLATAAPSVTAARAPMTLLLATAHGRGSVTVGAGTARLHGRIWLDRRGGSGVAHGKATVACVGRMTETGKGYTDEWFQFQIGSNGRQEIWRYGGDVCTVTVSLKGTGLLTVALRGY